jgi:hypothetical protein
MCQGFAIAASSRGQHCGRNGSSRTWLPTKRQFGSGVAARASVDNVGAHVVNAPAFDEVSPEGIVSLGRGVSAGKAMRWRAL